LINSYNKSSLFIYEENIYGEEPTTQKEVAKLKKIEEELKLIEQYFFQKS